MYKGKSVEERADDKLFIKRMDSQSKNFSQDQMDAYLDTTIEGFTVEQVGHMAWYLGIKHEQMLREKEAPKGVYADKDAQLTKEHLEPADEDEPEL